MAELKAGTEGYGLQARSTLSTITPRFAGSGNIVGGLKRQDAQLASYDHPTSVNHIIVLSIKAAISSSTPQGAYHDQQVYRIVSNF